MARDDLFRNPERSPQAFRFDGAVADVFDDMIRRSIPGYDALCSLIAVAARRFSADNSAIYDLGCSLGTVTLAMRRAVGRTQVRIIAVDSSEAMLERCRGAIERDNSATEVELVCGDAADVEVGNASLVVMNFTLQFMPAEARLEVLKRIRAGLRPDGALILSEKLDFTDAERGALLSGLHDDFRRYNGYSDLEISRKRNALETVLHCDPEQLHTERLAKAGFSQVEPWFRCLNFSSWLARP